MPRVILSANDPKKHYNILVVRNDGLGDLILTLPIAASLKKQLGDKKVSVTYLVNHHFVDLCRQVNEIDDVIADKGIFLKRHRGLFSKQERKVEREKLHKQIVKKKFDLVLCIYGEKTTAAFLHRCKIPLRVGSLRRAFFYHFNIFFTYSRKKGSLTEWQANLLYLKTIGLQDNYIRPTLMPPKHSQPAQASTKPPRQSPRQSKKKEIIILHPYKRAATALSWSLDYYYYLAKLLSANHTVVIIGDKQDEDILQNTFSALPVSIACNFSLLDLFFYMQQAYLFIGNASGPLHLASLAELNHLGIFPPDKAAGFSRWQTLPSDKEGYKQILLAPQVEQQCNRCLRNYCPLYSCMNKLLPQEVISVLQKNLRW